MEDQLHGPPKKGNPSPMMLTHHFNRHTQTWMWPTVQNMWRPEPEQRLTTRCGGIKTICFLDANKSFLEAVDSNRVRGDSAHTGKKRITRGSGLTHPAAGRTARCQCTRGDHGRRCSCPSGGSGSGQMSGPESCRRRWATSPRTSVGQKSSGRRRARTASSSPGRRWKPGAPSCGACADGC